jgi:small subunit ribosomal protein S8
MSVVTDPIADLLTRIRNANAANHDTVEVSLSKLKLDIVKTLHAEGFIRRYEVIRDGVQGRIKIHLKYGPRRQKVITQLKRVSKPGLRVYAGSDNLPKVLGGMGIAILTTSKGVLTDRQARQAGVGGEVLCYIW